MTPCHPSLSRLMAAMVIALPLAGLSLPASAAVMISQVYGGGGNSGAPYLNDFVELHNSGAAAVSLDGWSLQYSSAAGTSWAGQKVALSGNIPAGGYFLVQLGSGGSAGVALPSANATGTFNMSATAGKLALVSSATSLPTVTCPLSEASVVDLVGYGSTANCAEPAAGSTPAPAPSASLAILRKTLGSSCQDSGVNASDFATTAPAPRNASAAAQACGGGSGGGGGATPVAAAIYSIQGSGAQSAMVNQRVLTRGVVTKLNSNGFFIQDLSGDGNPATSDGIFVFTGSSSYAAAVVGNLVDVVATVEEFNTGALPSAATPTPTLTELGTVGSVTLVGSGYSITPTVVTLPEATEGDLERYEGMLVTLTGPFTVAQNYFQGRYGQLTLGYGGRLETPTNRHRPGSTQALALADENARRRIIIDDGSSLQNPNPTPYFSAAALPRAGDTVGSITGVIDFGLASSSSPGLGDYKIHPTAAPVFATANPRSAAPAAVGGNVKVASFNVLNYFTTFTNGNTAGGLTGQGCSLGAATSASNCRGADSLDEFLRQRAKIVEAMAAMNADALGLMEIQNNGNAAVQNLVDALNTRLGAVSYASVSLPAAGTGTDAIRVAMIYRPAKLAAVGAPVSDTDAVNNRPTLAQTFALANGERFTLLVNHFKSKGSCPGSTDADYTGNFDAGDGQGCWNAQRVLQAQRLRSFIAQRQAAAGSDNVLVIGDLNAYAQEDPVYQLTSSGFVDQIGRFSSFGYSYVFDGAAGRLDHAISNSGLSAKVSKATHWHINADESLVMDYNLEFKAPAATCGTPGCPADPYTVSPYRSSDHDPVLLGLNLFKTITGTAGRDVLVGTPGDDILIGGAGADTLTGGAGSNRFVYTNLRDAGDTVTDFVPGKDQIDLGPMLTALGYTGNDAVADGWVRFVASGTGTSVQVDVDGPNGAAVFRPLLTLAGVSPSSLSSTRDLLLR